MASAALEPIVKLRRDLRSASSSLSEEEARFLVDYYYQMQKSRIRSGNQVRQSGEDEPHEVLRWLEENSAVLERNIKSTLRAYAESKPQGEWALSQHGIGEVITAGLLAHVRLERAPSVSSVWRFAGLDPTAEWKKKTKRPWNARLKVICWHAGECFKRTSGSEKSFYGALYRTRKEYEVSRNESGGNADTAKATLEKKKFSDAATRAIYEAGKLPPGRLDLRATRYAVKIFLSHYWQVLYELEHKKKPPHPWILEQGGHVHKIDIPNW